jgi:photosystem II stability/assembly factor-like uncharacterized protein
MSRRVIAFLFVASFLTLTLQAQIHQPTITVQHSGTTQGLIAVSPVNAQVVWASGRGGTFVRTTNGGKTWKAGVVPGAADTEFRDVQGVSDKIAYLLSIGNRPTDFRIYKTVDGGATWKLQFKNQNPSAFYDCFAFWTPTRGIVHSDSISGVFPDRRTTNGTNWNSIANNMPPALVGEFSFASSGTCVATEGLLNAWIATGGASSARVLATRDGGNTWNAFDTPLVSNPSAGAFTVAFRDAFHGIVGGGDLDPADPNNARTAISDDGGRTWQLTNRPPVTGAIFGLAYVRGLLNEVFPGATGARFQGNASSAFDRAVVVTADEGHAAWTPDEGKTWFRLQHVNGFWAVAFANPHAGWLVGTEGRIVKISF